MASESAAERIAQAGRLELLARLRSAFDHQFQADLGRGRPDADELERLVGEAAGRAGGVLWRRSLAQAAMAELGIDLISATEHRDVLRAHELVGAPPYEPVTPPAPPGAQPCAPPAGPTPVTAPTSEPPAAGAPEPEALRIAAVHIRGIETLRAGERDIELRFSDAGLDVLKRSTGAAVGRLAWSDINSAELPPPARRGLRPGRRRAQELHLVTDRGRASFALPDLSEQHVQEHLQPMLSRVGAERGQR